VSERIARCATCRWWHTYGVLAELGKGDCRINPPTESEKIAYAFAQQPEQATESHLSVWIGRWPSTSTMDFCGKWEPFTPTPAAEEETK
jgi:hypothetical protein